MSTELKTNGEHPFSLTRYYGGQTVGTSIQVTAKIGSGRGHWINMTREEALGLSLDLLDFARKMEIDDE